MQKLINRLLVNKRTIQFIGWLDADYQRWDRWRPYVQPIFDLVEPCVEDEKHAYWDAMYVLCLGQL